MATPGAERGQWGSRVGFILAAAGSAVGLGNFWRFPYVTGQSGGAAFVVIYLACVALVCLPYLFAELVLGRHTQKNPLGAIRTIRPGSPWVLVGGLCVLTGVFILSYYAVIAGWTFGYIFKNLLFAHLDFGHFIASPWIVVPLFALFLGLTMLVVFGGVEEGIERWSKVLMPLLILLMLVLIVRSVTLEGAEKGLAFYLKPDFSKVTGEVVVAALGQAFFSLSLGMGAMITYGSYLSKREDVVVAGSYVALFDTLIALMAGFMIFPAVFATGHDPASGPALVFIVLPEIFQALPLGNLIGALFFLLLSIAALTSTVSLLEVVVAYFVDERRWSRKKSVWTVGALTFLIGLPSALSQGTVAGLSNMDWLFGQDGLLGQHDFLSIMDAIWGNLSLALGALLISIFVGWVWGADRAAEELQRGSRVTPGLVRTWRFFIRYVCPVVIFIILLNVFRGYLG
ncbi:sodium-dependent transporter [Rhodothermus marinus]|uniref:sodium-dependent transporter n=1 Tax=Rhodothermus marinus TaxID=29549 RepID=UPI001E1A958A|nr:sodium-dependent transporter [Rhodothermus marinus]MBO2490634.1 sodium-dependent transporter [Rhodothermus marinus]